MELKQKLAFIENLEKKRTAACRDLWDAEDGFDAAEPFYKAISCAAGADADTKRAARIALQTKVEVIHRCKERYSAVQREISDAYANGTRY